MILAIRSFWDESDVPRGICTMRRARIRACRIEIRGPPLREGDYEMSLLRDLHYAG